MLSGMNRKKIFFDVSRSAGVPAPRANFANVLFNGEAWGFYTLIEQIDDQFLDWRIGDDGGNLFKAGDNFGGMGGGGNNAADLAYYGGTQVDYENRYELKSNEDVNDWTDLVEFIDFINNSTDAEFENELSDHLELQEYLRSAAIDNAFSNLDSYTGSARNYYIYHNLTTNKWEWVKWDGNESFGSYSQGGGNMTTLALDYHDSPRPLLSNVFNNSALYTQYLEEMCIVVEEWFNPDYMNALIDDTKDLVQESVYADDNKMYSNADFDNNIDNNVGQAYGLKSFVASRHTYLTGQLDCTVSVEQEEVQPYIQLFPNPAEDVIYLSSLTNVASAISIFDAFGRCIYKGNSNGQSQFQLNISDFASGSYLLIVQTEHTFENQRFVKY
jgi:spore coat protein CotH